MSKRKVGENQKLRDEIKRLRAALREIEEKSACTYSLDYDDVMEVRDIARKALKEVPRG